MLFRSLLDAEVELEDTTETSAAAKMARANIAEVVDEPVVEEDDTPSPSAKVARTRPRAASNS